MVHNLLPAGRTVTYRPDDDEQIPTIPVEDNALESAITQASDAIVEDGNNATRRPANTIRPSRAEIFPAAMGGF